MSSQRFILFTLILFLLGAMPFLIAQPSAAASAGISMGFGAPLEYPVVLAMLMCIGICAALLPRDGLLLLPVAFVMMIMIGGLLVLDVGQYPALRYFVLGAILCMGLLLALAREKFTVLMLLVLASVGFHLGGFYMSAVPTIAAPMYFLIGVLLSLGMVLAISVAFGMTLLGDHEMAWDRLKQSPRFSLIRSIFL